VKVTQTNEIEEVQLLTNFHIFDILAGASARTHVSVVYLCVPVGFFIPIKLFIYSLIHFVSESTLFLRYLVMCLVRRRLTLHGSFLLLQLLLILLPAVSLSPHSLSRLGWRQMRW